MSRKKIDEITLKEIVQKFGFPLLLMHSQTDKFGKSLNMEQTLRIVYKYNVDIDRAFEFESNIKQIVKNNDNKDEAASQIINLIDQYEDIFDKSLYLLYMSKLLEKQNEKSKSLSKSSKGHYTYAYIQDKNGSFEQKLLEAKKLLSSEDIMLISSRSFDDYEFLSSQDFIGHRKLMYERKKEADRRLRKIESKYSLEELTENMVPLLISDFFRYPNVANFFIVNLYKKFEPDDAKIASGAYQVLKDENLETIGEEKKFDKNEFVNILRKHIEFIDIDKMLLMCFTLAIYKGQRQDGSIEYEDYIKIKKLVDDLEGLLENKNVSIGILDEKTVNLETIKLILKRASQSFINKKYYTSDELADLLGKLEAGEVSIDSIPPEDFKNVYTLGSFDVYEHELSIVDNQPNGLRYLVENNILSEEFIKKMFMHKDNFTVDQVLYLISKKIFQVDDIIKFYADGKITPSNTKLLKKELENIGTPLILSEQRLVELYLDPYKIDEFDEYRKIYKLLEIDETPEELEALKENEDDEEKIKQIKNEILRRKREIGEKILSQSDSLIDIDKMYELYHMGLLQIDTLVDFIGVESVSTLYESEELKPVDAKRLYDEKILTIEMIKEILMKNDLSEGSKLGLIYSTFPSSDEDDTNIREELLKYMSQLDDTKTFEPELKNSNSKEKNNNSKETNNKYFSDPCARWNLMSSLDSEYSQEFLKNGWIVFYLPNEEKYIIEKLYSKDYSPAYGAATYILSQKTFKTFGDDIIKDKFVDRSFLVKLEKDKTEGVKKIIHTGWGNAIMKYFNIDEKERYSEKEKEKIRKLAQDVEKSKKPLNKEKEEK